MGYVCCEVVQLITQFLETSATDLKRGGKFNYAFISGSFLNATVKKNLL